MPRALVRHLLMVAFMTLATMAAFAQLPQRDLVVELREIDEASGAYVVSTRPQTPLLPPHRLMVSNGAQARISYQQSIPLQWTQSAQAAGPMTGAGVKQALIWLQAGQGLLVRPRWPGGKRAASVELEMQSASVQQQPGAELPTQQRGELVTTVQAPLGEWVTIARSGQVRPQGSYGSEAAAERPRLLQLRVSTP